MRTGLVSADKLFLGGEMLKDIIIRRFMAQGAQRKCRIAKSFLMGLVPLKSYVSLLHRVMGLLGNNHAFSYEMLNSPLQNSLRCARTLRFERSIE